MSMRLTEKFGSELRTFGEDGRKRIYLSPVRVVCTRGEVSSPESLLENREVQVILNDGDGMTTLKNGAENTEKAMIVLDFGREIHGTARFVVQGCTGRVRVSFGESVTEAMTPVGKRGSTNDHAQRDRILSMSSLGSIEPGETGFRFLCIELPDPESCLILKAVTAVLICLDIDYIGGFDSSDPLLKTIYDTAAYTVHLNMQEYIWDGIKRDRLIWLGDMHPEVLTVCSVFGNNDVVPRSMDKVRMHTPAGSWMNGISSYSLWWIMCQYDWYMQNGDEAYLREQKDYLAAVVEMSCGLVDENGCEKLPEWRFLNWQDNGNTEATHAGLQGLLALALGKAEYLLGLLGEKEISELCRTTRERMKKHLPTPGGSKKAAALLALSGLADFSETEKKYLSSGGAHGYTPFFAYYIAAARAEAGHTAEALDDLRSFYGGMLRLGATSFWEDFNLDWIESSGGYDHLIGIDVPDDPEAGKKNIHADFGENCYTGLRHSLCHGWSGAVTAFFAQYILGVRVLEPGCRKLSIRPQLCGLDHVEGSYPTPFGPVSVRADKNGLKVTGPDEIEIVY